MERKKKETTDKTQLIYKQSRFSLKKNPLIISKNSIICILCYLFIKFMLDYSYIKYISPIFAYAGFFTDLNIQKLFESYFMVFFLGLYFPKKIGHPSDFLLFFFFLTLFIPLSSIYAMKNGSITFFYTLCICFVVMNSGRKITKFIHFPAFKSGHSFFIVLATLLVFLTFARIIARGGISLFNLNIWYVYNLRGIAATEIYSGVFAYLMPLVGKVVLPSLLAFFLLRKRKISTLLVVILAILFFGFTHHKIMLFYPFLILGFFFFLRIKNPIRKMLSLFIVLLFLSLLLHATFHSISMLTLFIRRALFLTADLHFVYHDFFTDFGQIFMSNSLFSHFFNYPLEMPVQKVISLYYIGHDNSWMNAGFLATGYMHFGYWGMLVFSFIVAILFGMVDKISSKNHPIWFPICLVFPSFISLSSADLTTAVNTHGIAFALIALWFFKNIPQNPIQHFPKH